MKPKSLTEVVELLRSLPPGTSMDAAAVAAWLAPFAETDARESPASAMEPAVDLTVDQVADRFQRGTSTVRTWCASGEFPNAYRLHGREWRIPSADVEAMQAREAARHRASASKPAPVDRADGEPDLSSWRRHLKAS